MLSEQKNMINKPKVHCAHREIRPLAELREHPKNPNRHPAEQLRLLGKVIVASGWRSPIVVSARSGFITKGHGRLQAAKLAGLTEAPIDVQEYADEAAELADMVADNKIAELSDIDEAALAGLLAELDTGGFNLELAGFAVPEVTAVELQALAAPEPPASVAENIAEINKLNADRRAQGAAIVETRNTEKFLIVVFPSLPAKTTELKRLGLPDDERYIAASEIKLSKVWRPSHIEMPKTAAKNKTGATG